MVDAHLRVQLEARCAPLLRSSASPAGRGTCRKRHGGAARPLPLAAQLWRLLRGSAAGGLCGFWGNQALGFFYVLVSSLGLWHRVELRVHGGGESRTRIAPVQSSATAPRRLRPRGSPQARAGLKEPDTAVASETRGHRLGPALLCAGRSQPRGPCPRRGPPAPARAGGPGRLKRCGRARAVPPGGAVPATAACPAHGLGQAPPPAPALGKGAASRLAERAFNPRETPPSSRRPECGLIGKRAPAFSRRSLRSP